MIAYTRRQLALLLGLVLTAGAGLAIGEWRRAQPELEVALETFDRAEDDDRAIVPTRAAPRPAPVVAIPLPLPPRAPDPLPRPARVVSREPLDLNRASADDLTRLPGVGPVLAARIVASRETGGAFGSVDDLRRVPGLGAGKLAAFRDRVTVSR